jgi:hypothetical protein
MTTHAASRTTTVEGLAAEARRHEKTNSDLARKALTESPFARLSYLVKDGDGKSVYTYFVTGQDNGWCLRTNGGLVGSYPSAEAARTAHDAVCAFLALDGFKEE